MQAAPCLCTPSCISLLYTQQSNSSIACQGVVCWPLSGAWSGCWSVWLTATQKRPCSEGGLKEGMPPGSCAFKRECQQRQPLPARAEGSSLCERLEECRQQPPPNSRVFGWLSVGKAHCSVQMSRQIDRMSSVPRPTTSPTVYQWQCSLCVPCHQERCLWHGCYLQRVRSGTWQRLGVPCALLSWPLSSTTCVHDCGQGPRVFGAL
jgi:hypothetical protein